MGRIFHGGVGCLISVLMLSGCAITQPASETMIFHPFESESHQQEVNGWAVTNRYRASQVNKELFQDPRIVTDFTFPFESGYLQFTTRPQSDAELRYAKRKFSDYIRTRLEEYPSLSEEDLIIRNPHYLSIAMPVSLFETRKLKWNLNVGTFVLGMDMTVRIHPDTYLTANIGSLDGEVILQRKLIEKVDIGIAAGAFYRAERRGFDVVGDQVDPTLIFGALEELLLPDRVFYNHTVGGRAFIFLPISESSYFHITASPGYALNLDRLIVNFGVGLRWDLL